MGVGGGEAARGCRRLPIAGTCITYAPPFLQTRAGLCRLIHSGPRLSHGACNGDTVQNYGSPPVDIFLGECATDESPAVQAFSLMLAVLVWVRCCGRANHAPGLEE